MRSSWLTLDRKALLVADASSATTRAAWASSIATARAAVRSTTRRSRASFWDSTSPYSRAFSMAAAIRLPTVYSSGPSPGRTSRPDARLSTASTPTVRPLATSGVPRNEVTSIIRAKVRLRSSGSSSTWRKRSGPSAW